MPLLKEDKEGGAKLVFGVPSSRGKGVHEVIHWKSGVWSCACTGWIIHKSGKPYMIPMTAGGPTIAQRREWHEAHSTKGSEHCAHIADCIAGKVKAAGTVFVVLTSAEKRPDGRARANFSEEV